MKATMATPFDVSAACFRAFPSLPPLLSLSSPNLYHTRCSYLKSTISPNGRSSIGVEHKFPKFCMEAALKGNLEATGVPASVPVRVADELLLAGHRYLDVSYALANWKFCSIKSQKAQNSISSPVFVCRTPEEFNAGHAPGAINIPYLHRNIDFLAEVSSHFRKDDEIIVGCQLGKRSMMAATDLLAAGFTGVTDIAGGYDAWTQNGLPTEL